MSTLIAGKYISSDGEIDGCALFEARNIMTDGMRKLFTFQFFLGRDPT